MQKGRLRRQAPGRGGVHTAGLASALFDHPREKVFTLRVWLRFSVLLLAVVAIGFALGFYVLPDGLGWFVGALILAERPRCLR
jgi:hypothetical protein